MQVVDLSAASDKMLLHLDSWQLYYPIREWRTPVPRRVVEGADVEGILATTEGDSDRNAYKKLVASSLFGYRYPLAG